MKILVVEDEKDLNHIIRKELEAEGYLVGAGAAWLGAGAAGAILDTFTGAFTVNEAQMLSTQMKMARPHVAFSMKSVVLR